MSGWTFFRKIKFLSWIFRRIFFLSLLCSCSFHKYRFFFFFGINCYCYLIGRTDNLLQSNERISQNRLRPKMIPIIEVLTRDREKTQVYLGPHKVLKPLKILQCMYVLNLPAYGSYMRTWNSIFPDILRILKKSYLAEDIFREITLPIDHTCPYFRLC